MAIVIADCCQNHNGDRAVLKDMVAAAAGAGADYVKIQTIFAEDLTYREPFEQGSVQDGVTKVIKRPYQPEYDRLKGLEIDVECHAWFGEECRRLGLEPMTTLFSRSRVPQAAALGWDAVKVASYDCGSLPLLNDLKGSFKWMFVSTGATYDGEVAAAAKALEGVPFVFLHCVTIYPTPLDQLHLARMDWLRQYTRTVGFSDHTLVRRDGIKASAAALAVGADVIERHFTILPPDESKDGPVSVDPAQLKTLCDLAHGTQALREDYVAEFVGDLAPMIGQAQRELSPAELLNRAYYRGRFGSRRPDGGHRFNWEA